MLAYKLGCVDLEACWDTLQAIIPGLGVDGGRQACLKCLGHSLESSRTNGKGTNTPSQL